MKMPGPQDLRKMMVCCLAIGCFAACCAQGAGDKKSSGDTGQRQLSNGVDRPLTTNEVNAVLDKAIGLGASVKREDRWMITRILSLNENDLVLGLSVFLKYTGKYPASLEGKAWVTQVEQKMKTNLVNASKAETKRLKKDFLDVFCAKGYYDDLVKARRDVKYYGEQVSVQDTGRILMRWKTEKGQYRVLFSDLRPETITGERLAELEKKQTTSKPAEKAGKDQTNSAPTIPDGK